MTLLVVVVTVTPSISNFLVLFLVFLFKFIFWISSLVIGLFLSKAAPTSCFSSSSSIKGGFLLKMTSSLSESGKWVVTGCRPDASDVALPVFLYSSCLGFFTTGVVALRGAVLEPTRSGIGLESDLRSFWIIVSFLITLSI